MSEVKDENPEFLENKLRILNGKESYALMLTLGRDGYHTLIEATSGVDHKQRWLIIGRAINYMVMKHYEIMYKAVEHK